MNKSSDFVKLKMKKTNMNKNIDLNTSNNDFNLQTQIIDQTIKVGFMSIDNSYSNISMNKSKNNIDSKTEVTPIEKDIYYDEVIYYDGGDVKGYGYN